MHKIKNDTKMVIDDNLTQIVNVSHPIKIDFINQEIIVNKAHVVFNIKFKWQEKVI